MHVSEKFIKGLPKAELHLHIEGSLEPELMFKLATRNNIVLPYQNVAELKGAYQFNNLQDFLDIYYQGAQVLVHEEDFYDLTYAYFERVSKDHVVHTEIFFDPQTHTDRGVLFETVIQGISRACRDAYKDFKISSHLIMCFLRHLSQDAAFKTLEASVKFKDLIIAVGLDSSEVGHPPSKFENVFKKAKSMGYKAVAHAGEEGPPEYIWEVLDLLGASRIDHGVRCLEDKALVEKLKQARIPLTVCPLSNIKLGVFDALKYHNLKKLLDYGLCATINSDDPAYFGGYMNENFIQTQKALNLTMQEVISLSKNAFEASFLEKAQKKDFINTVDDYTASSKNFYDTNAIK